MIRRLRARKDGFCPSSPNIKKPLLTLTSLAALALVGGHAVEGRAQSVSNQAFEVLDPRAEVLIRDHVSLTPRLATLKGKRIAIVKSWPDNSGFDATIIKIADALRKSGAKPTVMDRNKLYSDDDPELWKTLHKGYDAFVYVAAASSSTTAYAFRWSSQLEHEGLPGVVVNFTSLGSVGNLSNQRFGAEVRRSAFQYPPEDMSEADFQSSMAGVSKALTSPLQPDEKRVGKIPVPARTAVLMTGTLSEVEERFHELGLTDGLPVVPPTRDLVAAMLRGTSHAADEIVSESFPPEDLRVTVRDVAVNGVMAGCRAEHMPVLLATIEAFQKYNLNGILRSTNNFSFMQVVNGPIRAQIGMNSGSGALGPGNRSNACMGRALRLFITNLGDGHFDKNLMGVIGNVSNYAFMFAENEEQNPWTSLSEDQGFTKKDNVLTLFTGGWGFLGNYGLGTGIEDLPPDMARFQHPGGAVLLVSPARAKAIAADGMSKADLAAYIEKTACRSLEDLRKEGRFQDVSKFADKPKDSCVPRFTKGSIKIVVVGNSASPMMQAWQMLRPQSVSIDRWR